MPVVLLVRHGQASFGAADYDVLSDVGRTQAKVVGAELLRRGLRRPVVACGTLRRQHDTATIALAEAGLDAEPQVDVRWNEYDHLDLLKRYVTPGDAFARGSSSQEAQVLLDSALLAWVEHGDAGGWPAFAGGVAAALAELVAGLDSAQDAVVFTSGGVVAATCASLLGLPAAGVVGVNRVTANAAITKLVVGRSGTSLITFNDHAHFEGESRALLTYR